MNRGSVVGPMQRLFEGGTVAALSEAQLLERFVARGDQAAFEAIVVRHGPMVLGVCRRVLDDPHDVDDAFQATFLILVKKARSIRDREVLAAWLYGVARRVAVRAKVNARRRTTRERIGVEGADVSAQGRRDDDPVEADEVRRLIDGELERLPGRYRAPLILCDLEGQTHEQAAAELRCPVGTVKSRLARGRAQLRSRLVRRGLAPSAALLTSTLTAESASAVPIELTALTLRAASTLVAGRTVAAGAFSVGVVALVKGVTRSMLVSKLKLVALAVPALVLTVACAWTLARQAPAPGDRTEGKAESAARNPNQAAARKAPEGAERFALGNGLTVFLRPIQGAKEVDLVVVYSVGSDHDPEGRTGLGHMVEHLYLTAAAGTAKARTIQQLAFRYPNGANGQTGHRYTVLSTSFDAKDLDEELRDAAARMSDLRITAADLDRERERLLEEVDNMFGFMPALGAMNHARELARPTPGGGRHGGLPEHVRKFKVEDVQTHWARYYKPSNAIIGLAGAIDPATARKAIETHFGKLAAGEKLPAPREPGAPKLGTVKEVTVEPDGVEIEPPDKIKRPKAVEEPFEPEAEPHVSIAYPAPQPDSDLYAPFLILAARLWAGAEKLGDVGPTGPPVYFTPLDDGSVVAITTSAKRGQPAAKAIAKLEAFVADTLAPKLEKGEANSVREQFGLFFGTVKIPDAMLAQNPYGAVFSMARREQLGIDPDQISKALGAVTEQSLRRAAKEIFAPDRHAAALVRFRN